jgi:hypothetical protein
MPPIRIEQSKIILTEGIDDSQFLQAIIEELGFAQAIQIIKADGTGNIPGTLKAIKLAPGFGQVQKIVIIRDSDDFPSEAIASIRVSVRSFLW